MSKRVMGLTGIAALEAEMRDRLADKQRVIERLSAEIEGERDAYIKCAAALAAKDKAMGVLVARLQAAGADCSDLFS